MDIKKQKNYLVVKKNNLIEARYKLKIQEQKLILTIVSMIKPDDKDFKEYKLSVKEFIGLMDVIGGNLYTRIRQVCKRILKKPLVIREKDTEIVCNWFSAIKYERKEGIIFFKFDSYLKPYLLELQQRFNLGETTNYRLKNILQLKSIYSIRLYELLKQYLEIKERFIELVSLRLMLGIEKNQYCKFSDFRRKILEKSENELLNKTDIKFKWDPVKTGRKITGIQFFIKKNKAQKRKNIEVEKDNIKIELNEIQELINFVPERYQAKQPVLKIIEKYLKLKGTGYVKKHIEYANYKAKKNYTIFLKRSLSEGWDIEEIEEIKQGKQNKHEQERLSIIENKQLETIRKLKIKIVENLIPEQEQNLRDYIYQTKSKKDVSHDNQNKRSRYRKGTLVMYFESYLVSVIKRYIKSLNVDFVSIDEVGEWFEKYMKIKEPEIFNSIIQDKEIKKYFKNKMVVQN